MENTSYTVHPKETLYFIIKIIVSVVAYAAAAIFLYIGAVTVNVGILAAVAVYIMLLILLGIFLKGLLIGMLRGNAVKITPEQFPDIYAITAAQCRVLGLSKMPDIYLMEHSALNAFATGFLGRDYVVIFSEILETAYEGNKEIVEFVIAHELGHVIRKHQLKNMLLLPSVFVPFLNTAYSRACEYTCDSIGAAMSPWGVRTGLVLLASGKKLRSKVNAERFVQQQQTEGGFWWWMSEKISSHPHLSKRVAKFMGPEYDREEYVAPVIQKPVETVKDHSGYMPK